MFITMVEIFCLSFVVSDSFRDVWRFKWPWIWSIQHFFNYSTRPRTWHYQYYVFTELPERLKLNLNAWEMCTFSLKMWFNDFSKISDICKKLWNETNYLELTFSLFLWPKKSSNLCVWPVDLNRFIFDAL